MCVCVIKDSHTEDALLDDFTVEFRDFEEVSVNAVTHKQWGL